MEPNRFSPRWTGSATPDSGRSGPMPPTRAGSKTGRPMSSVSLARDRTQTARPTRFRRACKALDRRANLRLARPLSQAQQRLQGRPNKQRELDPVRHDPPKGAQTRARIFVFTPSKARMFASLHSPYAPDVWGSGGRRFKSGRPDCDKKTRARRRQSDGLGASEPGGPVEASSSLSREDVSAGSPGSILFQDDRTAVTLPCPPSRTRGHRSPPIASSLGRGPSVATWSRVPGSGRTVAPGALPGHFLHRPTQPCPARPGPQP